jgi:hypothetical protein
VKKRLGRITAIIAACLIGGLVLFAVLSHWMSTSSKGTVHVGSATTKAAAPAATTPLAISTLYFTTNLPGGFVAKTQTVTPSGNPILLQYMAATPSASDQQFAATIGILPSDGLDGISSYHLRASKPDTYTRATLSDLPSGAVAYTTITGASEYTVFWPHGSNYAQLAISTTGTATPTQLQSVLSQVIKNWTWK